MTCCVVDTNVLVVANLKSSHASDDCALNSIEALRKVQRHGTTVLDDGFRIFDEYRKYASLRGQPGLGDAFIKHLHDNLGNPRRCLIVAITPRQGQYDFEEFPRDRALRDFDLSDRKFVAVARRTNPFSKVINATDTDWWEYRVPLRRYGVEVEFLCREHMRRRRTA